MGGGYGNGGMMRQVDERDEDMGMDEYGVSKVGNKLEVGEILKKKKGD
jgi:hypothetical protein